MLEFHHSGHLQGSYHKAMFKSSIAYNEGLPKSLWNGFKMGFYIEFQIIMFWYFNEPIITFFKDVNIRFINV